VRLFGDQKTVGDAGPSESRMARINIVVGRRIWQAEDPAAAARAASGQSCPITPKWHQTPVLNSVFGLCDKSVTKPKLATDSSPIACMFLNEFIWQTLTFW